MITHVKRKLKYSQNISAKIALASKKGMGTILLISKYFDNHVVLKRNKCARFVFEY